MSYLSIIFDLDGTLLDTVEDIGHSVNEVLESNSIPTHPLERYKTFVGEGLYILMDKATGGEYGKVEIEQLCHQFKSIYGKNCINSSIPYPGINEMIRTLHGKNVQMNVLSNKPHNFTVQMIDHFFAAGVFRSVYGYRQQYGLKPDPEMALNILQENSVKASDAVFVGDSGIDIETGKRAGMGTIAVTWGFRPKAELQSFKPDVVVNHPEEIVSYVDNIS